MSSPIPHRSLAPYNLISLAILKREHAIVLRDPENSANESLDDNASNLFGAVTNLYPVILEISSANSSANPSNVLIPVPTAVTPRASSEIYDILDLTLSIPIRTY